MQTPVKVTLDGFYRERAEFLEKQSGPGRGRYRVFCRTCGEQIKVQPAQIEIHEAANGQCKGNGEVFEAGIPYCPACEELPAGAGCVHA